MPGCLTVNLPGCRRRSALRRGTNTHTGSITRIEVGGIEALAIGIDTGGMEPQTPQTTPTLLPIQDVSNEFVVGKVKGSVVLLRLLDPIEDRSQVLNPILTLNGSSVMTQLRHGVRNGFPYTKVPEIMFHLPLHFRAGPYFE